MRASMNLPADASHELRTPVTVIRGSLEALNDKVVTDKEEVEQYYRQMLKESLFLQRLINDLLDLSRLQNTDFPIEKEHINLCDVVQDAARASKQLGQKKMMCTLTLNWTGMFTLWKATTAACARC